MSEKVYDVPKPIDLLDELIETLESELAYRSDGDDEDRLNYLAIANLRSARVALALASGVENSGVPRWE